VGFQGGGKWPTRVHSPYDEWGEEAAGPSPSHESRAAARRGGQVATCPCGGAYRGDKVEK
jgi:hypothetical protein